MAMMGERDRDPMRDHDTMFGSDLFIDLTSAPVRLRMAGRFNVSNALCAGASGLALGLTLEQVAAGLSDFRGVRGRLEPVDRPPG